jgi:hypothetical protein
MKILICGSKLNQGGKLNQKKTPLTLTHKFENKICMNKWMTFLSKL